MSSSPTAYDSDRAPAPGEGEVQGDETTKAAKRQQEVSSKPPPVPVTTDEEERRGSVNKSSRKPEGSNNNNKKKQPAPQQQGEPTSTTGTGKKEKKKKATTGGVQVPPSSSSSSQRNKKKTKWKQAPPLHAGHPVSCTTNKNGDVICTRSHRQQGRRRGKKKYDLNQPAQVVDWNWGRCPSYSCHAVLREIERRSSFASLLEEEEEVVDYDDEIDDYIHHDDYEEEEMGEDEGGGQVVLSTDMIAANDNDDTEEEEEGNNDGRGTTRKTKRMTTTAGITRRRRVSNILEILRSKGIRVYLVEHDSLDLLWYIRKVSKDVAHRLAYEKYYPPRTTTGGSAADGNHNGGEIPPPPSNSCLLYKDVGGRLYNVVLEEAGGLADDWQSSSVVYSGMQGIMAMVVLSRTFGCADVSFGIGPLLLGAVLGLVLTEEISFTRMNVARMTQGVPSVAAYLLLEYKVTDWPKHLLLAILSLAGAASVISPSVQTAMTLIGVTWSELVLASNLGARAWRNLDITPLPHTGKWWAMYYAYLISAALGLSLPFLGLREVWIGGQSAVESIVSASFWVAVIFVLSDFDAAQRVLVVGSELCSQNVVNIVVGGWWMLSTLSCIFLYKKIPRKKLEPDERSILIPNEKSPVGYSVPHLPDYVIYPKDKTRPPSSFCSECMVRYIAVFIAIVGGAAILGTGLIPLLGIHVDIAT